MQLPLDDEDESNNSDDNDKIECDDSISIDSYCSDDDEVFGDEVYLSPEELYMLNHINSMKKRHKLPKSDLKAKKRKKEEQLQRSKQISTTLTDQKSFQKNFQFKSTQQTEQNNTKI
jgi:DNA polymerase sigma